MIAQQFISRQHVVTTSLPASDFSDHTISHSAVTHMSNRKPSGNRSQNIATLMTTGAGAFVALSKYAAEEVDLIDLADEIHKAAAELRCGDWTRITGILVAQILLLNCVSNTLIQRAPATGNFEGLLKIALKCQAQCARTAAVVALLKEPLTSTREAAYLRDQVETIPNDTTQDATENEPDELLIDGNDTTLDPRRAIAASGGDSNLATVVRLDRAPDRGRKGQVIAQCR